MGIKYCSIWKRLLHSHRELSPETIFLSPTVLKTSIHTWIHHNLYKLVLEVALEILSPESHLGAEHFYSSFSALWGLPVIIDASVLPFLEPLIRIMFCWELVWWPSSFYSLPNCRGWENDSFMSMIHLPPGTCSIIIVPRVSHNLWWPEHSWVWVQAKIICTMLHAWLQLITKALSNRLQEEKRPPPRPRPPPDLVHDKCIAVSPGSCSRGPGHIPPLGPTMLIQKWAFLSQATDFQSLLYLEALTKALCSNSA